VPGFIREKQHWLRRHWLITALLLLAAALRGVVLLAYRPALIFPDSLRYLQVAGRFAAGHWSPDTIRPSGYSILIAPATAIHVLALIPLAQHVLGLAEGAMIYALLTRRAGRRWLAALAAVPILFDPLQLDLEQYVLSDVCAAFFVTTALVVLAWNGNRAGRGAMAAAGLLLAAAAVTRVADLVLIIPAVLYVAVIFRPWRKLAARGAVLAGCFLLPVVGYAGWFATAHGPWGLSDYNGTFLYGRVVQFANCTGLPLPSYERPLCPTQPPAQRNYDFYMWSAKSPQWRFVPPPGLTRQAVVLNFSRRILAHQPLSYAGAVGTDIAYSFSPVRGNGPEHYPAAYLKFQAGFPPYDEVQTALSSYGHSGPTAAPQLTAFLSAYGRYFYVPGPLLAAGLLIGLAGLAGTRRSRRRGLRSADLLFAAGAVAAVAGAAAFAPFDWRYQLPQLTLIPVAAAFGWMALASCGPPRHEPAVQPDGPPAASAAGQDHSPVVRFSGFPRGRLSRYHRMVAASPAAKPVRGRYPIPRSSESSSE
jgi:4-amino-4-deoxy-L-arabinose transferase-like glycosyltransferase